MKTQQHSDSGSIGRHLVAGSVAAILLVADIEKYIPLVGVQNTGFDNAIRGKVILPVEGIQEFLHGLQFIGVQIEGSGRALGSSHVVDFNVRCLPQGSGR